MPFEDITFQNLKKFGRSFLNRSAKVSLFSLLDKFHPESQKRSVAGFGHLNGGTEQGSTYLLFSVGKYPISLPPIYSTSDLSRPSNSTNSLFILKGISFAGISN